MNTSAPAFAELQANATINTVVTIERLMAELEEARRLAIARGNASAAVLAIVAKAKLHGLMNRDQAGAMADKVVDAPERQRTPRELARMIAFALAIGTRQLPTGRNLSIIDQTSPHERAHDSSE